MRIRTCDKCGKKVEYPFYKIYKLSRATRKSNYSGKERPVYLSQNEGDLCEKCWKEIKK